MAKAAEKKAGGSKKMDGLQKPLQPSAELGAIVGTGQLSRAEVVSKVWEYIKKNNLQNPENKREIVADDKLAKVFGKPKVTMFEMNKHLSGHLKGLTNVSPRPRAGAGHRPNFLFRLPSSSRALARRAPCEALTP
jgi:upstream activation factor subunit UAF30